MNKPNGGPDKIDLALAAVPAEQKTYGYDLALYNGRRARVEVPEFMTGVEWLDLIKIITSEVVPVHQQMSEKGKSPIEIVRSMPQ